MEEDTNTVDNTEKYFAKYFRDERLATLNQSAGTLRPLRLSGIAAPERENPGRDLHVFTLSPTLLVDLLHSWKPDIPTVTMLPPQPVSWRTLVACDLGGTEPGLVEGVPLEHVGPVLLLVQCLVLHQLLQEKEWKCRVFRINLG